MYNLVNLIGRLTNDIELRKTSNSVSCVQFDLAVQRDYKNDQGERTTDFLKCIAFRGIAETLAEYCHKGDLIAVKGRLQTRSYEDKDGNKRYITEVLADKISFLSTKKEENKVEEKKTENLDDFNPNEIVLSDSDLPF